MTDKLPAILFTESVGRYDDLTYQIGSYYMQKHGKLPSFKHTAPFKFKGCLEKLEAAGFIRTSIEVDEDNKTSEYIYEKKSMLIVLTEDRKDEIWAKKYTTKILCSVDDNDELNALGKEIGFVKPKKEVPSTDPTFNIGLLLPSMNGLYVKYFTVNYDPVPLTNYSRGVQDNYEKIKKKLNASTKGLYLFTGEPGTGKTTLLRKLAHECNKNFIFINADNAELLGHPSLVATLMEHTKSVLVIEDGESSIASRADNKERSKFTSNLLNITDGLMSDLLQVQVIVTLNFAKENIDSAFRRAGRLQMEQEFEALSVGDANSWLKKHKSNLEVVKPTKLCDLYQLITPKEEEEEEILNETEENILN